MTRRFLLVVALSAVAALAGAALSDAAISSVSLKVKGPHITRHARFCGKSKVLRVFRRGTRLEYRGFARPAPTKHFPVLVQVDACVHGRFVRVARYHFQGKRTGGKFKGFFTAPRPRGRVTYFAARAVVGGKASGKAYFGVRR